MGPWDQFRSGQTCEKMCRIKNNLARAELGPIHNDCLADETPGQSSNARTSLHVVDRDGAGKRFIGDLSLVMEPNLRPLSPLVSNFVSDHTNEASGSDSGTPSEPDHSSRPSTLTPLDRRSPASANLTTSKMLCFMLFHNYYNSTKISRKKFS